MNQTCDITNTLGEVIHDHLGTYQTIFSGKISESEINQFILKDTAVGENDDKNFIVDMGFTNGCKYIWMNECSKQSVSKVAMGRSHAVYQSCTLETLLETEKLLYHSFADQEESQSILRNPEAFKNAARTRFKKQGYQTDRNPVAAKELLYNMVCYSLKQKSLGFRSFMYILVPDTEEDYQEYCKKVIADFLRGIPAGLRKQFRFATNAAEDKENQYHILFYRESKLQDLEKRKKSISVEKKEVPEFLYSHGLDAKLSGLLQRCIDSLFDSSKEEIKNCFEHMEMKMGDVSKIKEKDYRDYYEIITLGEQEVSPDVLKSYSEKLKETLAEKQKQMLKEQIILTVTDHKMFELLLKKDQKIVQADTMYLFFEAMKPYKTLIQYLKTQGIELSKEFYQWKVDQLSKVFWQSNCLGKQQNETKVFLHSAKEWKSRLEETNLVWIEYFKKDYVEETAAKASETYADLCLKYQNERLTEWKEELKKDFSISKMKENCQKVHELYPKEMKDFCQFIYDMLVAGAKKADLKDSFIKKAVNVLQQYDTQVQVPDQLYESYVRETMEKLLADPKKNYIEEEVHKIGEIYGQKNEQEFAASLLLNLAEKFKNKTDIETVFHPKTEENILNWSISLKKLVDVDKYYRELNIFESAVSSWQEKKRQEAFRQARKQQLQMNIRSFEGYFYGWKNENDLMQDLDIDKIRKAIYDKNKSYTLGDFLTAVSYVEGESIGKLLYDEKVSEDKKKVIQFYKNEFETFMQKKKLPILIKRQDTFSQIHEQVEIFSRLCQERVKDIKFIYMGRKQKVYETEVGYQTAEHILDMLIQIKNEIVIETDSQIAHKNLSGAEKEFWKFLNQCELLSEEECIKLIAFAEEAGTKDLAKLCQKFLNQKKKRKRKSKIVRGVTCLFIIAAFAAVFLAGRISVDFFSEIPFKTEGTEVSGHVQGIKMPEKQITTRDGVSKVVPKEENKQEIIEEDVSNGGEELYSETMD